MTRVRASNIVRAERYLWDLDEFLKMHNDLLPATLKYDLISEMRQIEKELDQFTDEESDWF